MKISLLLPDLLVIEPKPEFFLSRAVGEIIACADVWDDAYGPMALMHCVLCSRIDQYGGRGLCAFGQN